MGTMRIHQVGGNIKLPAMYVEGILDAVADGMSMAIRLKSAGCVIDAPVEYMGGGATTAAAAGRRGGRKRSSALASQEDGQHAKRPNYCNTLDFGGTSVFVEHLADEDEQIVADSDGDDGSSFDEDSDSESSGA